MIGTEHIVKWLKTHNCWLFFWPCITKTDLESDWIILSPSSLDWRRLLSPKVIAEIFFAKSWILFEQDYFQFCLFFFGPPCSIINAIIHQFSHDCQVGDIQFSSWLIPSNKHWNRPRQKRDNQQTDNQDKKYDSEKSVKGIYLFWDEGISTVTTSLVTSLRFWG